MSKLQKIIKALTGGLYIPDEALNTNGKTLLHISDTPQMLYGNLQKLIKAIQPDYIVHTGDMVDNIKLELYPFRLSDYKTGLSKLGKILNQFPDVKLYIAAGNHDNLEAAKAIFPNAEIVNESSIVAIEGNYFEISHYAPDTSGTGSNIAISFFGHDLSMNSQILENTIYLNGIEYINLVELDTLKVIQLEYPAGTNDSRLKRRKIGM